MTVMKEEDPESGFSRERFLRAIEASEVKLNQEIQFRQEREAKINSASKPVAKRAFDEKKLMNKTKSANPKNLTWTHISNLAWPTTEETKVPHFRMSALKLKLRVI